MGGSVEKERRKIVRHLSAELADKKRERFFYRISLFFIAVIELISPQMYGIFVDEVFLGGNVSAFVWVAAGSVLLYIMDVLCSVWNVRSLNVLSNAAVYRLRQKKLSFFMRTPDLKQVSEIGDAKLELSNDVNKVSDFFKEQFGSYEVKRFLVLGSAAALLVLEWRLALIGIAAVPVTLFFDRLIGKKEAVLNEENRINDANLSTFLRRAVSGWRQIRMFGLGKGQERKFVGYLHRFAIYNAKWINYWVTRYLMIPKLKNEFLMEFGVYVMGGLLIFKNQMTAGELLIFIMYYHLMTDAMTALSAMDAQLKSDMPIYARVFRFSDSGSGKNGECSQAVPLHAEKTESRVLEVDSVELSDVGFSYGEQKDPLFWNITQTVKKGDCVGIFGESGSGKTTLLKLLLGMEEPSCGRIFVCGFDFTEWDKEEYYRHVSGVLQGMRLFHDTIRENLRYANPRAKDADLIEACKRAQIWKKVQSLPEGLDTVVGEKGSSLSGGEAGRLLIARAFLKDADVYFFDEPASALDEFHARRIYMEIQKLSRDKIVFLVSHDKMAHEFCNYNINIKNLKTI